MVRECLNCRHDGHNEVGSSCIKNQDEECRGTVYPSKFQYNNWEPKIEVNKSEKIQTEYEWKKERCDLLGPLHYTSDHITKAQFKELEKEHMELSKWLEENKPEKWVQCTRENTKVGDEVRFSVADKGKRVVEHFYKFPLPGVNALVNDGERSLSCELACYEININR